MFIETFDEPLIIMLLYIFMEHLDLCCAGITYKTTIVPSNTFFVVSFFHSELIGMFVNLLHIIH